MRHDVAGEGDVAELVEGDGLDEEGNVGVAGLDQGDGFVGLADVADVAETGDGLLIEAEELVEDDAVELDDVELGLAGGDVLELGGDDVGFWCEEVVAVAGGGEKCGARCGVEGGEVW